MKQNRTLSNGTLVNIIKDDKFQEVYMSLKVLFPLQARQNTIANLLTRMMSDRLESTDTKKLMSQRLDMMYGAKTSAQTYSVGRHQVVDLSMIVINDAFVNDDLLQKQVDFIAECFYTPLLNEMTLSEAKHNLHLSFDHIKDQPAQFAMVQSFIEAGKGQEMELTSMGVQESIDDITLDEVIAFHQTMIQEFHKQIYLVGAVEEAKFSLDGFEVGSSEPLENALLDTKIEPSRVEMNYDGTQTELVLIYETDITPHHELYSAYLVYIALLGQLPSSLLFQNIREKHSLAYSIYATRRMFDGVFAILTGINDANIEKTLDLIQEQIDTLKLQVDDLEDAKSYLVLQLEGIQEKQKPWSDHVFRNHILGVESDVKDIQEKIASVTLDQVLKVAKKVKAPFVFAYRGVQDETNA